MKLAGLACAACVGCGFAPSSAPSPEGSAAIVDDTVADFAAGRLNALTVDPLGLLAPEAYVAGGLHARSYASYFVQANTTWDALLPMLGPVIGERYGELPTTDWGFDHPYGVGLYRQDNFTMLYDGEIYLAGPTTLQLSADDIGFLDVDVGNGSPTHIVSIFNDITPARATITPPRAGWFPIRGAMSEGGAGARYVIGVVTNSTPTPITEELLRANVTNAHGISVTAGIDRVLTEPVGLTSVEATSIDHDWGTGNYPPYDLPGAQNTRYSLRYAGQLRIDEPGPFGFTLDTGADPSHYARFLIDGKPIAGNWPGLPSQLAVTGIDLAPGWHDVMLDFSQNFNAQQLRLAMSTPTIPAAPIRAENLRPVRARGLLSAAIAPNVFLVDATATSPGVATAMLPIVRNDDGATTDFVDMFFNLSNETRTDLQISLASPSGTSIVIPLPAAPVFENYYDYDPDHAIDTPVSGTWVATFTDTVFTSSAGYVNYPALVATYHGGKNPPFGTKLEYVSAPHPTDGGTTIRAVHVTGDLRGATLAIQLRAGDASVIDDATWHDVDEGAPLSIKAGEVVEYRLELDSDGWSYATVDKVEIDYDTLEE